MEVELLVTWIDKYKKEQNPIVLPDPIDTIMETMERKGFKDLRTKTWFQPLAVKQLSAFW